MNRFIFVMAMILVGTVSEAGVFNLPQLDPTQTDPMAKEFAADLAFRPVEGATPLEGVGPFGVSAGVTVIATNTNSIQSIIGSSPQYIPNAVANFAVGLPMGFGVELGVIPTVTYKGTSFDNYGGDLRWNFGRYLKASPVDLTLRGMLTSAKLSSTQSLMGATITADYKTTITGAELTFGKRFFIFEPYMGVGLVHESSNLSYSGSVSLFNSNFASGTTNVPSTATSFWGTLGLQVRLLIFQVGGEYSTLFGNPTYALKIAVRF